MEIIWQAETRERPERAIRLIMDENGRIIFQHRSPDLPEWTDLDEVVTEFWFAV